jgi:ankyrin repeat protein
MKFRAIFCLLLFWGLATGGGARAATPEATSDLVTAIVSNKPDVALAALDAGADINANVGEGRTPLISAVMFSRPEMVKMLLERGADPNRRADDAIIGSAVTAAFFAMNGTQLIGMGETSATRHATALEVLKLIVSAKGANLNLLVRRATSEMSPLMIAADAGAADAVQILLDAGANPNTMNGGKYTALDYAVDRKPGWSAAPASNRVAVVRALLAKGARKDRKPADGVTPAERAKRAGNAEISTLLAAR